MLNYLKIIYLDSNRREKARTEFKKLVIKKSEKYYTFFTRFLHLANKVKILADYLKKELRNRLIKDLKKYIIVSYIDINTFVEYFKKYS